jgi:hypothetical protein
VNLTAPAPRTSHGTPDLSGLWIPEPDPKGIRQGVENAIVARYLFDVTQDVKDAHDLLIPSAEATYRKRVATDGVAERFRRIDLGHLEVEVTYTDPGTFKTPLTFNWHTDRSLPKLFSPAVTISLCEDGQLA